MTEVDSIRCLVADDSASFRSLLRVILAGAPGVTVVGEAADGEEAVRETLRLRPDVVTMDVRMPRQDGLAAIEQIMRLVPTPIVVVSAAADDRAQPLSFQALQLGAVEVLGKPRAEAGAAFERQADEIRMAVRAVAGLNLITRHPRRSERRGIGGFEGPLAAVGIAASTGGPAALARILSGLPADYPAPILVVQHIAAGFEHGLARWLSTECGLHVKLADEGDALGPGMVVLAREGRHLVASGGAVRLSDAPPVRRFKPSGTVLFASIAGEYGSRGAGLVLSGMGDDGAEGLGELRRRGGFTAAQGPASSVVYGMPRAALESGSAEHVLEIEEIPDALRQLASAEARGPQARRSADHGHFRDGDDEWR